MTATECMKRELNKIQQAQSECVSPEGFVYPQYRYRYQVLIREGKEFRDAIKFLETKKEEGWAIT